MIRAMATGRIIRGARTLTHGKQRRPKGGWYKA